MLLRRLIQPYDPTNDIISDTLPVRITHAGQIHYEFAFDHNEGTYVLEMALTTPIRDRNLVTAIKSALIGPVRLGWDDWHQMAEDFIEYCVKEDFNLMALPKTPAYDGQRIMRKELSAAWLGQDKTPLEIMGICIHLS